MSQCLSLSYRMTQIRTHALKQVRAHSQCVLHTYCAHFMSVWFDIRSIEFSLCITVVISYLWSLCAIVKFTLIDRGFSRTVIFVSRWLRLRLSLWWEPLSGRVLALLRETKGVEDCGLLVPGWGAHGSRGRGALGASWASLFGLPPVWQRHHEPRWRQLEAWGRPCLPPGSGGCPVTSWQPKTATSQCHCSAPDHLGALLDHRRGCHLRTAARRSRAATPRWESEDRFPLGLLLLLELHHGPRVRVAWSQALLRAERVDGGEHDVVPAHPAEGRGIQRLDGRVARMD